MGKVYLDQELIAIVIKNRRKLSTIFVRNNRMILCITFYERYRNILSPVNYIGNAIIMKQHR
jgi:hypothetical protein